MNNQLINLKKMRPEELAAEHASSTPFPDPPSLKKGILKFLVILAVLLLAAKVVWFVRDSSKWRAVFLTNNQVYFGKFMNLPFTSAIALHDIYYLQVNQAIQPQNGSGNPEIKVVKLGEELHSPEDRMIIPRQQILYWENLKPAGSLVQTIQKFQAGQK